MSQRLRARIERLESADNYELTWIGLMEACRHDDDRMANRYLMDSRWHSLIVGAIGFDPLEDNFDPQSDTSA